MSTVAGYVTDVPFVDLGRHHRDMADELVAAFESVLDRSAFVLGEEVQCFEEEFAAFCGVGHGVGVASGTSALTLALLAAGIGPGDEVIVPAHTYIASALAVMHAGARPVFCDVRADTGLIDVESAEAAISAATAAVIPVHLYGQCCDMDAVRALAERHGLFVLEDAAQAHGATWDGKPAGSLGDAAAFSFYPSKNLGALGDGGAVCTDDPALARRVQRLRDLGQEAKGRHVEVGYNERLDGLQAALLRIKLRRLPEGNATRRELAGLYCDRLPERAVPLVEDPRGTCVYHLFPVRVAVRERLRAQLGTMGIQTGVHYAPAVHEHPAFADLPAPSVDLGRAVTWASEVLSLPMFADLTAEEVERAAGALTMCMEEGP